MRTTAKGATDRAPFRRLKHGVAIGFSLSQQISW